MTRVGGKGLKGLSRTFLSPSSSVCARRPTLDPRCLTQPSLLCLQEIIRLWVKSSETRLPVRRARQSVLLITPLFQVQTLTDCLFTLPHMVFINLSSVGNFSITGNLEKLTGSLVKFTKTKASGC